MLGVDTNVVVRFLAQDHPSESKRANAVFREAESGGSRLFVSAIVLCEIVWVLRSAYRIPRDRIAAALDALLETPEVVVEDSDLARRALSAHREGADFTDHFLGERNRRSGCEATVTFDRELAGSELFRQL